MVLADLGEKNTHSNVFELKQKLSQWQRISFIVMLVREKFPKHTNTHMHVNT